MAALAPVRAGGRQAGGGVAVPVVHDDRLRLDLFAADPAIATPIGIAVDSRDRVFVLESHTHLRPAAYQGPTTDRVKVFTDADRDGRADEHWGFAAASRTASTSPSRLPGTCMS